MRPLAWRVESFRDTQARVSVWTVTILSAAGVAAPQSEFLTVTLDLAWLDGDWRVDGVRDTPGSTPITGPHDQPWDAEPFDRALDGFTRMDGERLDLHAPAFPRRAPRRKSLGTGLLVPDSNPASTPNQTPSSMPQVHAENAPPGFS